MKVIEVEMADGTTWRVPAEVVAENRAAYYATLQDRYDKLKAETLADDTQILEWSANEMNWEDVKSVAVQGPSISRPPDYQEGWVNGPRHVIEVESLA